MLEVHIADAHQEALCGFERFANSLAHVCPRGSCGRCIDCSGLSSHVHSVSSTGSVRLNEYEQWWPAGLQSPTLYYHIKARQLKYQLSLATRRAMEWRDTAFGPSDLLHKRGMQQMPLHVPAAYTNVQENERVIFVKQIKINLEPCKATCLRSPFALLSHTATLASSSCDQTVAFSSEEKTGEVQTAADFAASIIPCLTPPSTHPNNCMQSCFAEASVSDSDSSCQLSGNDSSTSSIGYAYHQPTKRTRTASGALPSHICTGHFLAPAVPASLAQSCQVSSLQAAPACQTPARNTLLDGAIAVTELRPVPGTAKCQERELIGSCQSSRDVIIPVLQSNVKAGGGLCSPVLDGHLVGQKISMGNARDAVSNGEEGPGGGWFGQWLASWLDVNA